MTRIAYLFPGQGSQREPNDPAVIETARKILGFNPFETDKINLTAYAQPAILSYSVSILNTLEHKPDYLAGHSLGEYTALVAGGVLSFEEALRAVHYRGKVMQEAVPIGAGSMLVVLGEDPDKLADLCEGVSGYVTVANYNCPGQTVLSGSTEGIESIKKLLRKSISISVSAPFHCELMKPAQDKLANYLAKLDFKDSHTPIISNVTAQPLISGSLLRDLLIKQVTAPVQFTKMLEFLKSVGVSEFMEIGPGKTLTNLVKRSHESFTVRA